MGELDSKVIVITGGSMGIGLEVAKQCAAEGAKVVIAARNEGNLKTACSLLDEVTSCERFFYRLDIGNYQEVTSFAAWCGDKFGAVYGLVNCAGIYGPIGKAYKIDIAKFAETIQINFLGVVHMCPSRRNSLTPGQGGRTMEDKKCNFCASMQYEERRTEGRGRRSTDYADYTD